MFTQSYAPGPGLGLLPRIRSAYCDQSCGCAPQNPCCCGESARRFTATRRMFGLAQDGSLMQAQAQAQATITQTVAERVAAIRQKMVAVGIPVAVGSGVVTMLTFAGAFGLARTERVWMPAIWLGALTTIGGLIAVATAAKTSEDVAKQQEAATTPVPTPVTPAPVTPTLPQTSTFGSYYGYGY